MDRDCWNGGVEPTKESRGLNVKRFVPMAVFRDDLQSVLAYPIHLSHRDQMCAARCRNRRQGNEALSGSRRITRNSDNGLKSRVQSGSATIQTESSNVSEAQMDAR